MANLKYGSSGDDVKKLQENLNQNGYSLDVDGIFGNKTLAAVKDYQTKNGLEVDGIAGDNTLGKLYGTQTTNQAAATQTPTTQTPSAQTSGFTYKDFNYKDYAKSDTVLQAEALLNQHNANKPGAYQSQWQDEIDDYMNKYQNRDPFSYDFNSDALYHQYKDQYIQQGQMAMMDTMGQAQAMTGGYGNSYAQTVGQQVYNQNLNQLNNIIPELQQMAYDRYNQEGQDLLNMYNMYLGREDMDYGRYMDELNAWEAERAYLADNFNAERDYDYRMWENERSLAHDEYTAGKNQAWEQYLMDLEKEQAAAELMVGAGNYDRLKDIYGLTDDELSAIKEANKPKTTGGGGGTPKPTYTKLTHEDRQLMQKEVAKAASTGQLSDLVALYLSMGYDPAVVNSLTAGRANELSSGDGELDTTVPVPNLMQPTDSTAIIDEVKKQREKEILNRYGTKNGIVMGLTK